MLSSHPKNKNLMANHSATKKDVRQSRKRNERNRYYGKTTRNAIRDLKVIDNKDGASEKLSTVASMIDKLAKRGIIHKNKAANLKSKLTKSVSALTK
jgi:small subunit ribosomal protein S20